MHCVLTYLFYPLSNPDSPRYLRVRRYYHFFVHATPLCFFIFSDSLQPAYFLLHCVLLRENITFAQSKHIYMTHFEIWLMALALAMDCFAVSVASGIIFKRVVWRPMLLMAFSFGLFQALNPLLGWVGTHYFRDAIESFDHWLAFAILVFLGGRMVVESFKDDEHKSFNPRSYKVIFTLAIATSIDALAVGVSFSCMGYGSAYSLFYPLTVIGLVSFLLSLLGLGIGLCFGKGIARRLKAELLGGVILVGIGFKVLLEHLME